MDKDRGGLGSQAALDTTGLNRLATPQSCTSSNNLPEWMYLPDTESVWDIIEEVLEEDIHD